MKKILSILLLFSLFFIQIPFLNTGEKSIEFPKKILADPLKSSLNQEVNTTGYYSTIPNGQFELVKPRTAEIDEWYLWSASASPEFNISTSTTQIRSGTKSLQLYQYLVSPESTSSSISQNIINSNIDVGAYFDAWVYFESKTEFLPGQDYFLINIRFNNSKSLNYEIGQSNMNYSTITTLRNPIWDQNQTWVNIHQNITADYRLRWPSDTNINISSITVYLRQNAYRGKPMIVYLDDFSIISDSIERITNGGFEIDTTGRNEPDGWMTPDQTKGAVVSSTNSQKDGLLANMTAITNPINSDQQTCSNSLIFTPMTSYLVSAQTSLVFSVDYYITGAMPTIGNAFSKIELLFDNGTYYYFNFRIYDTLNRINSSTTFYQFTNLNQSGQWYTFSINLTETLKFLVPYNLKLSKISLIQYHQLTEANSISIAWDNVQLQQHHPIDSGFEGAISELQWQSSFYMIDSTDKTEGQKSLNLSNSDYNADMYYILEYPLVQEFSLSLDYKIEEIAPVESELYIRLQILDIISSVTYELNYHIYNNLTVDNQPENSSFHFYFNRNPLNQKNQWKQLNINLINDLRNMISPLNYSKLVLRNIKIANSQDSNEYITTILLDNIKIGSDLPLLESLSANPSAPVYNADWNILADLLDEGSGIGSVTLHYSIGTSEWVQSAMQINNSLNQIYQYSIPNSSLNYNETVQYYIVAQDNVGNRLQTQIYNIRVNDTTAPVIEGFYIESSGVNLVNIKANISDDGSGIKEVRVVYEIDGNPVESTVVSITNGVLNKTIAFVGSEVKISIQAVDFEGNFAQSDAKVIKITGESNPLLNALIIIVIVAGIGVGLFILNKKTNFFKRFGKSSTQSS